MSFWKRNRADRALMLAVISTISAPVVAQIEEIVVTAQKREENLQDVAIAITALPESALQDRDIRDFETYLRTVPGTTFANQGNQGGEVKIRGVGNGTSRLSPTVAVYLGEVPVIHNGRSINSSYDFYISDIQRIEVLRGPQGQLYGSNSLGGAIKNVPNKPDLSGFSLSTSVGGSAMHGGSESYNGDLTVNVPLTDTMGLRFTGYGAHQGGWIDNIFAGGARIGPGPDFACDPSAPLADCPPLVPRFDTDINTLDATPADWLFGLPVKFLDDNVTRVWQRTHDAALYERVVNYRSPSNVDQDVNQTDRYGARGMFTWNATDAFTVDIMLAYENKENDGTSWVTDVPAIPGPWPTASGYGPQTYAIPRAPGTPNEEVWNPTLYPTSAREYEQANNIDAGNSDEIILANLVLNWDLGFGTLTSSTGYWDRTEVLETPLPLGYIATGVDGTFPVYNQRHDEPQSFTQEIRLASAGDDDLTWLIGGFYQKIQQDFTIDIIDPTGFMLLAIWPPRPITPPPWPAGTELGHTEGDFTDEQIAVFGQVAYDLLPSLNLALSARWFDLEQSADIVYSGPVFNNNLIPNPTHRDRSYDDVLPKATLSWTPVEGKMFYLTAAEGFRSGVVNEELPGDVCALSMEASGYPDGLPDTDPDTTWNYELGAKLSVTENLTVNATAYHIKWEDLQSQVFMQGFAPGSQCTYDRLLNVGNATINGAELEVIVQLTEQVRLDASAAYTDGQYDDDFPQLKITEGTTIEGTAEVTAYLGAQYDFDLWTRSAFIRGDVSYTGDIAKKPTDFLDQPQVYDIGDFYVANMRAGLGITEQLRAEFFVQNLFDEFGVTRALDLAGAATPTYFTIPPRSVGLTVRYKY